MCHQHTHHQRFSNLRHRTQIHQRDLTQPSAYSITDYSKINHEEAREHNNNGIEGLDNEQPTLLTNRNALDEIILITANQRKRLLQLQVADEDRNSATPQYQPRIQHNFPLPKERSANTTPSQENQKDHQLLKGTRHNPEDTEPPPGILCTTTWAQKEII